ncbi:MAG: hypothetical protein ACRC8Y_21465 [Chroococcales cyanobacterium]
MSNQHGDVNPTLNGNLNRQGNSPECIKRLSAPETTAVKGVAKERDNVRQALSLP